MKLRVYVSPPGAEPGFTEIDSPAVREVSGSGGVFAAHPEMEQDEEGRLQPGEEGKSPWRVTHLPSGLGLPCPLPTRGEAEYLARQVFAAKIGRAHV